MRFSPIQDQVVEHWATRYRTTRSQAIRLLIQQGLWTDGKPQTPADNKGRTGYIRLGDHLIAEVDKRADAWGKSRAETLRLLLWTGSAPVARDLLLI